MHAQLYVANSIRLLKLYCTLSLKLENAVNEFQMLVILML